MNSSPLPVLKWLLLLLLPLTLGWKLAVRTADVGDLQATAVQRDAAEFLVRQRFAVVMFERIDEGQPMIRATAGDCRLLVAKSPATGSDRDVLHRHATPADRLFVVFRGRVYSDQPTWLTVSDFLWARFRRELGMKTQAAPVLTIIATTSCDAERLPWNELG